MLRATAVLFGCLAISGLAACGGTTTVTKTVTVAKVAPTQNPCRAGDSSCTTGGPQNSGGNSSCSNCGGTPANNNTGSSPPGGVANGTPSEAAAHQYNGQNPSPKCGFTGSLHTKYVSTDPGSNVAVKTPEGQPFGHLLMRYSKICKSNTVELFFSQVPKGFEKLYINLKEAGGANAEEYESSDTTSPAYTAMLSIGESSLCQYAVAWVVVNHMPGPHARTPCLKP